MRGKVDVLAETPCAYCGLPLFIVFLGDEPEFAMPDEDLYWPSSMPAHLDHVIPECLNGPTSLDNTVIACVPCNLRKGGRAFGEHDFLMWLRDRRADVADRVRRRDFERTQVRKMRRLADERAEVTF